MKTVKIVLVCLAAVLFGTLYWHHAKEETAQKELQKQQEAERQSHEEKALDKYSYLVAYGFDLSFYNLLKEEASLAGKSVQEIFATAKTKEGEILINDKHNCEQKNDKILCLSGSWRPATPEENVKLMALDAALKKQYEEAQEKAIAVYKSCLKKDPKKYFVEVNGRTHEIDESYPLMTALQTFGEGTYKLRENDNCAQTSEATPRFYMEPRKVLAQKMGIELDGDYEPRWPSNHDDKISYRVNPTIDIIPLLASDGLNVVDGKINVN